MIALQQVALQTNKRLVLQDKALELAGGAFQDWSLSLKCFGAIGILQIAAYHGNRIMLRLMQPKGYEAA